MFEKWLLPQNQNNFEGLIISLCFNILIDISDINLWKNENIKMDQITTSDSIIIEESILSDDDEKIRVYGSTRLTSPSKPKSRDDDQSKV
jgi:hypothetical protein